MAVFNFPVHSQVNVGEVVRLTEYGAAVPAIASDQDGAVAVGIAITSGIRFDRVLVDSDGIQPDVNVIAGQPAYLSASVSGAIAANYEQWLATTSGLSNVFLTELGVGLSTPSGALKIEIQPPVYINDIR